MEIVTLLKSQSASINKEDILKTASEIVNYLTRHYQEKSGYVPENLLPEIIDDLVGQMGLFLETRLEEDTPYKAVWDEFAQSPEDNSASLVGILEALFEAQPSVRERVNGFMREITAVETKESDNLSLESTIRSELNSETTGLSASAGEITDTQDSNNIEKNPPTYLYGNERAGFEASPQAPISQAFLVGENAQIVYNPAARVQFPGLFDHLSKLVETSKDLNLRDKRKLQKNLKIIRLQLTGKQAYEEKDVTQSINAIWEISPSLAGALIESLQSDLEALPSKSRSFIVQLNKPNH